MKWLVANFIGIYIGFIVYHLLRPANQIAIQVPIAVVLTILLFLLWNFLLSRVSLLRHLALCDSAELIGTVVASLIWAPVVFVPLHYFTQGYLTGIGNIIAMLLFQLPVNMCTVVVIWLWWIPKGR